jgi:NAD(P)-dependent dehydrogenase (short-subunit alcohol dehydrogenase family)
MKPVIRKKGFTVGVESKVAVLTGASQGIGAALVMAHRDRDYRVVAAALSMEPLSGDDVVVVSGDIKDRKTAERAISQGMARFGRIDTLVNNAASLSANRSLSTPRRTARRSWASISLAAFTSATRRRRDGETRQRPCRTDHDEPRRPHHRRCTRRSGGADEGWPECRDQIARDRVCPAPG